MILFRVMVILKYITRNFKNTLVLATEAKKIYCDEISYVLFPEVIKAIEQALINDIKMHAQSFYKQYSKQ